MDFGSIGVATVAAITVICYLVGLIVKVSPWNNDRYIPIACGLAGGVLGIVALYTGMPNFPAADPLTAAAIGIVSGLAATGVNQIYKQLAKAGDGTK